MLFESKNKEKTAAVVIHVSLFMCGDVVVRINRTENGTQASWTTIADGGLIVDEGEKELPSKAFIEFMDLIFSIDFPEEEDESADLEWEILCEDNEGEQIVSTEPGCWDYKVLRIIVDRLEPLFDGEDVIERLKDMIG